MAHISDDLKKQIGKYIDQAFENTARHFFGYIPGDQKKTIIFSSKRPSVILADIFVSAMGNKKPNQHERDGLKGLVRTANNYVTALRDKTKASILDKMDSAVRENGGEPVKEEVFGSIVQKEMDKAKNNIKTIVNAESGKTRNLGVTMDITRIGASLGIDDPLCYFQIRPDTACKYCRANHTIDGTTPRVFKISEVKTSYLTKEELMAGKVSLYGGHVNCLCRIIPLTPDWGFKDGKLAYIAPGHDEFKTQRG